MKPLEKGLCRIIFKNMLLTSHGNAFENLFTQIISNAESGFRQIKPWGNLGDGKNDGYIPNKGIYYQVYAPEDIKKSYPKLIAKLKTDLAGLIFEWEPVSEFYFVVNDKYQGVEKNSAKELAKLKKQYSLNECDFITASTLENMLFKLDDDVIYSILNFLPNIEAFQVFIKNHTSNISKPLLSFLNYLITKIHDPISIDDLWIEYDRDFHNNAYKKKHTIEELILSLSILYGINLITEENGFIHKCN